MLKAVLVAAVMTCGLCLASQAHADQKSDDVNTLLLMTGQNTGTMEAKVSQQVHLIFQTFVNAHPDLTGAEIISMETQITGVENQFVSKMAAEMVTHYEMTLTDDQIRAVIAFYGSADGRAYLAATKSLAQQYIDDVRTDIPALFRSILVILQATLKGHSAAPLQPGAG